MRIARTLGLDDKAAHTHLGFAIWLAGVLVAGDAAAWWPLALVIVAELGNEALDRVRTGSWRWRDTLADIATSILWPCVLFACARAELI